MSSFKKLWGNDIFNFSMLRALNHVIMMFATVFLNLYFYDLSEGSMTPIAIYNLVFFTACGLVIFLCRNINKGGNKMLLIRVSLVLYAVCFVVIAILREDVINFVWLVGILLGGQHGMYFSAKNPLEGEIISNKIRVRYMGIMVVVNSVLSILFPLVFGGILTYQAYYHVSIVVAVFVLIALFFACRIKSPSTNRGEKTKMREYLRELKKPENKPIRIFGWAYFFGGMTVLGGAMASILTIIKFQVFDTNMALGAATSAFTVFSIISGFVMSKFINERNRNRFLLSVFFLQAIAVLIVAFYTNTGTIIAFSIVNAFCLGMITGLVSAQFFNYINHKSIKEKYKIEYIVVIEMFIAAGRILGFTIMVLGGVFFSYILLQIILVVMVVSLFMFVVLSCIVKNKMCDQRKDVLVFDCDGTITHVKDNKISDFTYDAIKKAQEKYIIVFATGRNLTYFKQMFGDKPVIGDYAVLNDGASVYDLNGEKLLFADYIKKDKLKLLLENLNHCTRITTHDIEHKHIETKDLDINEVLKGDVLRLDLTPTGQDKPDVIVSELNALGTKLNIHKMKDSIRPNSWVVVTCGLVNKGNGLKRLAKVKGFDLKRATAFGDSYNDISFFEICGKTVAVENAEAELLAVAGKTIGTNEDDAVAKYIIAL
ncbi:MAG: HAD-IIB family hydrolase [Firmicutes bacterium]|nr:HAD-IIB family hydrolase [Bacillota bacterium]